MLLPIIMILLQVGMVAFRMKMKTPEYPEGRDIIVICNDITHMIGSFGPQEDELFVRASELARTEGIPRIYLAANSGARIGLAEEVKHMFHVAWIDPADPYKVSTRVHFVKADEITTDYCSSYFTFIVGCCCFFFFLQGFKYLYLTPQDYTRISATNSVHCQHVEEGGESRYDLCSKEVAKYLTSFTFWMLVKHFTYSFLMLWLLVVFLDLHFKVKTLQHYSFIKEIFNKHRETNDKQDKSQTTVC